MCGMHTSPNRKNLFELLPDSLLVCIFNQVHDVKALGRCAAVCKHFNTLVPQVEDIVVKVDCVVSAGESTFSPSSSGLLPHLYRVLVGSLVKPLHALHQLLAPKKHVVPHVSLQSPGEVLKNFKHLRHLQIELPGGEMGVEDGLVLKWWAEFGSSLENCVILAAASLKCLEIDKLVRTSGSGISLVNVSSGNGVAMQDCSSNIPEAFLTDGALKLRLVWTISSLIAASARHYLLQQIVSDHPMLESLVLSDADGQGTLCMNKKQLIDFQVKPIAASASTSRTQVPALNMKLWYAQMLDLPDGFAMNDATLFSIRPSNPSAKEEAEKLPMNAFKGPFCNAAGLLAQRRTYLLEMNSF
ncbi:hypothetical protein L7F22_053458 [Adiantum nelumboides]|nr:hypothetical protein [Adiantum nelumboides]